MLTNTTGEGRKAGRERGGKHRGGQYQGHKALITLGKPSKQKLEVRTEMGGGKCLENFSEINFTKLENWL